MSLLAEKLYMAPINLEDNLAHPHCWQDFPLLTSSVSPPQGLGSLVLNVDVGVLCSSHPKVQSIAIFSRSVP